MTSDNMGMPSIDHDRLFKMLLTTFFVDFIALFLPEVSVKMDSGSVEFLEQEVFTDIHSGEKHIVYGNVPEIKYCR